MSLKGLKPETIDMDMVLLTEKSYSDIKTALLKLGYEVTSKTQYAETVYKNAFVLFKKGDSKIDIFVMRVCNLFDFSTAMMNRARLFGRYDKLNVRLASDEDIFLFKSITGREKDLDDLAILNGSITEWHLIINEFNNQKVRNLVIEEFLGTIKRLGELGITVPINSKLLELKKR